MTPLAELGRSELQALREKLLSRYTAFQEKNLALDMTRGKPSPEQLNLAMEILTGDIVLLHTRPEDMATTADALPELAQRNIQPVTLTRLYLDWLTEQNESQGCYADSTSLMRTCIE